MIKSLMQLFQSRLSLPSQPARRRKSRSRSTAAIIETLEPRRMLTIDAVDDTITLDPNTFQTPLVNVMGNDTGDVLQDVVVISSSPFASISVNACGDVQYSIGDGWAKLGEFTEINDQINDGINQWQIDELENLDLTYETAKAALERLSTFLNRWTGGTSSFGDIVASGTRLVGGPTAVAGFIVKLFSEAYSQHISDGFAAVINSARQKLIDEKAIDVRAIKDFATEKRTEKRALLLSLGNPDVYTTDTFQYQLRGATMIGDGEYGDIEVDTATVTVNLNVTNYYRHVRALEKWWGENAASGNGFFRPSGFANHIPPVTDINSVHPTNACCELRESEHVGVIWG